MECFNENIGSKSVLHNFEFHEFVINFYISSFMLTYTLIFDNNILLIIVQRVFHTSLKSKNLLLLYMCQVQNWISTITLKSLTKQTSSHVEVFQHRQIVLENLYVFIKINWKRKMGIFWVKPTSSTHSSNLDYYLLN